MAMQPLEQEDNTLSAGEVVISQAGVEGYDTVIYEVTYRNGVEIGRVAVSRTTTPAVAEIIKVGTRIIFEDANLELASKTHLK